jgi:RNA polymerase sigma-70 factor, ECF subfamily
MTTYKKAWELTAEEFLRHVLGCINNQNESEKTLYHSFYPYALSVCNSYAANYEDASEILNDGFVKVFKNISRFCPTHANVKASFLIWLRKIMVNSAIDHYRRYRRHNNASISGNEENVSDINDVNGIGVLLQKEIIRSVDQLTEPYRTVFKMRFIDGHSHYEIAQRLAISVSTSKSRLFKARTKMQAILANMENYFRA